MQPMQSTTYRIVRFFAGHVRPGGWGGPYGETVRDEVSLAEAQEHCSDPESSSETCTSAAGKRLTRERGPWFDSYLGPEDEDDSFLD